MLLGDGEGEGERRCLFIVLLSLTCVVMLMDSATGVMNGCFNRTIIRTRGKQVVVFCFIFPYGREVAELECGLAAAILFRNMCSTFWAQATLLFFRIYS